MTARSWLKKALRALISGRDEALKQATNDFHKAVKLGQDTIGKLLLANSVDIKLATSSTTGELTERRISQERDKILDWLSRIDYLKKQRDILAKHHGKTGKWFLDHPDFRLWMDGGENTILWCRGIRMYTGQGFLLSTYTKVLNSWCRENSDDDECDEPTRTDFLAMLLGSRSTLRLFLTSRKSVDLRAHLGATPSIEIIASTTDIRDYLTTKVLNNDRLLSLFQKDPDLSSQIINTVQDKAGGMFLLANLQIAHISMQSTVRKVRNALNSLPRGIVPFYEQAMERILGQEEEDMILAKKTLSFIFCARRPLSTAELIAALSVETGDSTFDEDNCPLLHTILGVCVGLVSTDENTGTIGLVHTTLQEYLQEHTSGLLADPHLEMASVCITYLSFRCFSEGPCTDDATLNKRMQQYHFLEYASKNWGAHARYSSQQSLKSVLNFLRSDTNLTSSMQVLYTNSKPTEGWHNRFPRDFTPIHVAAYWGLKEACEVFCQDGDKIDVQDSQGTTALHIAARHGYTALLKSLLAKGARPELVDEKGYTPLIWAGRNGHKASITPLILALRNIWTHDAEGWTALDWAIIGKHYDTAGALLSHYDQAAEATRLNKTLILAAEVGYDEAVGILLDKGAFINGTDEEGSTALDFAVSEGKEKVVRVLLERGADPNSQDNYCHTALHWAIAHPKIASLLLQHGATVDSQNRQKHTPLLWCAKEDQIDTLKLLIQSEAAVNACDEHGTTPLHAAAAKGNETMVKILLDKGADATFKDRDEWTPVHSALIAGHFHLLPIFALKVTNCQSIADNMSSILEDEKNKAWLQETAMEKSHGSVQVSGLRTAVNSGYSERVLALISAGEDINACDSIGGSTALTLAVWLHRLDITRILIENGADVDKPDATGNTALHIAVKDGYEDIVALLLSSGANIDKPLHSWTPLLFASRECHYGCYARIAELLVNNGADVKAADYHGRTALHWAAQWGQCLLAEGLVQKGALIDAQDRWGMTPLIWASASERTRIETSVINLLLANNANANIETKEGYRPIHLAALAGDLKCLDQLLRHGADPEAGIGTKGPKPLDIARNMKNEATVTLLEGWGATSSQSIQWQHARNKANSQGTKKHGSRFLDIDTVPNEVICVENLYQALRDLSTD
ncbi:hypothetical protein M0657_010044 [Pyricularia oryzae]|nr:hypothetical protein M0657_010044 [Pyricularia oryzae]